jgi:hypothetical protein
MGDCGINVRRTASKLVRDHGRDAMLVASQWVRCAGRAGDPDRHSAWLKIESLVHKMLHSNDITRKLEATAAKVKIAARPHSQKRVRSQPESSQPAPPAE